MDLKLLQTKCHEFFRKRVSKPDEIKQILMTKLLEGRRTLYGNNTEYLEGEISYKEFEEKATVLIGIDMFYVAAYCQEHGINLEKAIETGLGFIQRTHGGENVR